MATMPSGDPRSPTYASDQQAIWTDIRALWRRANGTGKSGGGQVIVQPDEPEGVEIGQLWYDTDFEATS